MPESTQRSTSAEVRERDAAHLFHPLHSRSAHEFLGPIVLESGSGAVLTDTDGKHYIDGLSSLWNVNVGHGRKELAEAAFEQMSRLAYASAYTGLTNQPAVDLATMLAELAYPSLNSVFFASGGAEANESAFKLVRSYWKAVGKRDKVKIIARNFAYHGVTLATMSATGMPAYWAQFEPRAPGFLHVQPPYCYRCAFGKSPESCALECADDLATAIEREGPETVAAFIAEPVQGAGGVIPPHPRYFPKIREICDRYGVLFIADEVITGFGRTGKWFALDHWGVQPDVMSFAKGVTSAYLPLGGIMFSDRIADVLRSLPPDQGWMHAYTYSGHPTCCAVGLRNVRIIEEEGLVQRAADVGAYLQSKIAELRALPSVGETRGLGMMAAAELVADRRTRAAFQPSAKVGARVLRACIDRGVIVRARGDVLCVAPPLITTTSQIDTMVSVLGESIAEVTRAA